MAEMSKGLSGFRVPTAAAVVLATAWLGGCGPKQVSTLHSGSHLVLSFEVEADYATVYERLAHRARQRYVSVGFVTHQPGVTTNLFPESQTAGVTLWDSGGVALRYRLSAEIRALDPTHTQVDLYAAGKSDRREARLWAAWAVTPEQD
jgi:hypothetical protein